MYIQFLEQIQKEKDMATFWTDDIDKILNKQKYKIVTITSGLRKANSLILPAIVL